MTGTGGGHRLKLALILGTAISLSLAFGQGFASWAREAGEPATIQQLRSLLAQRDAVIADLLQRVEGLERRTATMAALPPPSLENGGPANVPVPAPRPSPPAPQTAAKPAAGASGEGGAPAPDGTTTASAPGAVTADEEAVERALERTLVETGALLLPFGKVEVQPSVTYERTVQDFPVFVAQDDEQLIANQELRRNEVKAGLGLRVGLPFESQFELNLPYQWVGRSAKTTVGGAPFDDRDQEGNAFGDLSVGLAKTLLREATYWPDLVGRVRWDTGTGKMVDNGVGLGGGFSGLEGQLIASKRQDPLVFVGGVSYETVFEEDGFDPGDEFGVLLGTVLAASPETSLRFLLDQRFGGESEIDGQGLDGSDTVSSTLSIGASSILGRGLLLDVSAGVGLTEDAPDYSVSIALPVRFDLPLID